ncbi:MAG: hypothetical protein QM705_12495 [Ancrocorticia sp.]
MTDSETHNETPRKIATREDFERAASLFSDALDDTVMSLAW